MTECVVVFTFKGRERILNEEGTSAWRLHPNRAGSCPYAVCTRNKYSVHGAEGNEEHGSAFLIGRIKDVVLARDPKDAAAGRFLICFSEYAELSVPHAWQGDRNPVKYSTLEDLGINPSVLSWKPMPTSINVGEAAANAGNAVEAPSRLTIAEAKLGLARTFNVPPESIEIIVRG